MIDAHCHLDFPIFENDRAEVVAKSIAAEVTQWHIPGTQLQSWAHQIRTAKQLSADFSLGLHPYFLSSFEASHLSQLALLLQNEQSQVCGVGEIGLDGAIDVDKAEQVKVFEAQLSIAQNARLPVVIHHRKTHSDILASLKKTQFNCGGLIHAFNGSEPLALDYINKGYILGVGGLVTYPRGEKLRRVISRLPQSAIVLETDSPDMPINEYQGQRNEPCRLRIIAKVLADIWQVDLAEVSRITSENYFRVFTQSVLSRTTG